jgi:hypothetical protein
MGFSCKSRGSGAASTAVAPGRGDALIACYRDNSQIQFTSHDLPPSAEKDCSIRADFGEMWPGIESLGIQSRIRSDKRGR